ncbi:hypothetical protein ACPCSF_34680 [Streptomyces griseoincarnatus]
MTSESLGRHTADGVMLAGSLLRPSALCNPLDGSLQVPKRGSARPAAHNRGDGFVKGISSLTDPRKLFVSAATSQGSQPELRFDKVVEPLSLVLLIQDCAGFSRKFGATVRGSK